MAKRKKTEVSHKLLDAWVPPEGAGDPLGCIATTFTFDPVFFEEHCLSRFLRLETDPREDGAAYLINREEKLAVTRVCVLVDRAHSDGAASARWDVLPVNSPSGIFHPKIALLAWHNWVRLVIGSANLTEPAHRKNQEIFGIIDFHEKGIAPLDALSRSLKFIEQILPFCPGRVNEPGPKTRLLAFLRYIADVSKGWETKPLSIWDSAEAEPVFLAPLQGYDDSIPARLGRIIRSHGGPALSACVLSPFFDRTNDKVYPAANDLLTAMTDRGSREIQYMVAHETLLDGRIRLRAPKSLLEKGKKSAEICVYPVDEVIDKEQRPLHAKSVWLWNDRWHVYMIGSSNFTAAGMGVPGHRANFEANLAYVFREDSKIVKLMDETLPPWQDPVDDFAKVIWEPIDEETGEETVGAVLPSSFEEALYEPNDGKETLVLRFGKNLPASWSVIFPGLSATVYSSEQWSTSEKPATVRLSWPHKGIPNSLEVHWTDKSDKDQTAVWPVNVTDPSQLPPPDDLRNLSLETLLEILCSGRPLYEIFSGKKTFPNGDPQAETDNILAELDPLKRVSSETFLLQRTRRVAKAIEQLVESLSRPVVHRDVFAWRFRGPVGPCALAKAIYNESRTPGEASFLLTEIVLALRRIDTAKIAIGIDQKEIDSEIAEVIADIKAMISDRAKEGDIPQSMATYISTALQRI